MATRRVTLALGGGAAKGLAHVGVLRGLEEDGIGVAAIAGTSMGSIIGALYARGMRAAEMAAFFAAVDWARLGWIMVRSTGGDAFHDVVRETIGATLIEELEMPLAAVCCDLATGDEVVLREGSLEVLMRAFHIMQYNLSRMRSESTRTIEPEVGRFGWFDFQLAGEIMDEGYRAYREDGDAAVR